MLLWAQSAGNRNERRLCQRSYRAEGSSAKALLAEAEALIEGRTGSQPAFQPGEPER